MYKHAVVICGGKGSRLLPYTSALPKALVPIGGYPVLEVILRQLKHFGFTEITLSVHHFAQSIIDYFGNGSKWGLNIYYSIEDIPLGTAGPLKILKNFPENLLVINCDILSDLNFKDFFFYHIDNMNLFTIAGYKKEYLIPYGVLETNISGRLIKLNEKPEWLLVNSGIYAVSRRILDFIPDDIVYGMDQLIYDILNNGKELDVYSFEGSWQDIGTEEEYKKALSNAKIRDWIQILDI